jgi:hypothetical protein
MKILTTASSRSGGKIFSYFFHFQGLFNSRGLNDVKGFVPLSASREGDGCMKDTDHPIRHLRVHLGDRANAQGTRGCARRDDQFGRGQNPVLGWSDPNFAHGSVAKSILGSLQPTKIPSGVLSACVPRILRRNMCRDRMNKVKTVRITLCTFRTATSSPNARPTEFILKRFPTATSARVTAQERANQVGSDPTFWRSIRPKVFSGSLLPVAVCRCACFFVKGEAASLLAVKFSSSGEVGFTHLLHRYLTSYFTLDRVQDYGNQSHESSRRTKLCAAQTAPEAGATPPFDARCVTVAVWSLPPSQKLRGRVLRDIRIREFVRQDV